MGPGGEVMAPWALLSAGVLVRTAHTVLTWGVTLLLFLHDTGEPDPARPRPTPPLVVPRTFISLGSLPKPHGSWDSPRLRQLLRPLPLCHPESHLLSSDTSLIPN